LKTLKFINFYKSIENGIPPSLLVKPV